MGAAKAGVTSRPWGKLPDGRTVTLYTLTNRNGLVVRIMDLGGVIVGVDAPDRAGKLGDVVLGFDRLEPYLTDSPGFGAVMGRYANRIAGARFRLDGRSYQLIPNAGEHNLHGGPQGWDKLLWRARPLDGAAGPGLELSLQSPDGDQGFPGTVEVVWTYWLTHDNRLTMEARATTDAPTVINMTNHAYFNLSADGSSTILDHELQVDAASYTPKDRTGIPTGEIASVEGTPFDFRTAKPIGRDIGSAPGGYDHNLIVDPHAQGELRRVARARDPKSGRTLEVWSDQPGVQFYSAHWLKIAGKGGAFYGPEHGFCLEPQHYPDSPNKPQFPTTVLRPGQTFRWRGEFRFGVA
ncbi:galactose-1-epimerase [Phenylobacterium deserti]|uniref:Aldose 1-epimerase n=2 Tax=Phenylobacterium deserti TaxID=1914756 RepID=A0A328AVG9_9CAUL|nr:galactose-1-epimerase [Phenylobacterium deserti]